MFLHDPIAVASSFNDRINAQDLAGLSALMSDNHVFIDSANNAIKGRTACIEAWRGFFGAFPDYRNRFDQMQALGGLVVVVGRSLCSDRRLNGPALWTVRIGVTGVSEWRVYEDTRANRKLLRLPDAR
jgi:ketosteroid isomerase-like protein